jgi:glutamate formiminotransferase
MVIYSQEMKRAIACFANIQEGRDAQILTELATVASSVPGCYLLRLFSDRTFHRSGFLLAGLPESVSRATVALTGAAISRINLCSPERLSDP